MLGPSAYPDEPPTFQAARLARLDRFRRLLAEQARAQSMDIFSRPRRGAAAECPALLELTKDGLDHLLLKAVAILSSRLPMARGRCF